MDLQTKKVRRFYDAYSGAYDSSRRRDFVQEWIVGPAVLDLLGNIRGKQILDAGCGHGIYAAEFAKRGACVTAVDVSSKLLAIAERFFAHDNVRLIKGDLLAVSLPERAFDIVTCIFVSGHVLKLEQLLERFRVFLRPGGFLLITFKHPLHRCMAKQGGREIIRRENYFETSLSFSDWGNGIRSPIVNRPLSAVMKAIIRTEFLVTEFLEPRPIPDSKKVSRSLYERYSRWPSTLLLKAIPSRNKIHNRSR